MTEMREVPYATERRSNYENFEARCPRCRYWNIFNRVSDLNDTNTIAFKEVRCFQCSEPFNVNGDSINAPHEMLIYECYGLLEQKRYMFCVLNLAQAHEMFFGQYLRVELIYKLCREEDPERLAQLYQLLYEKTKKKPFERLKNIFLNTVLQRHTIGGAEAARKIIAALDSTIQAPEDLVIRQYPDQDISNLLLNLKKSKISELRNKVVHQHGYRPRKSEVEKQLREAIEYYII